MSKTILATAVVALAVGAAAGYRFSQQVPHPAAEARSGAPAERQPLFYRNPMNPAITSPVPAQDEMGMDYIPVYADSDASTGPAGTVRIDPVVVQNIGVRTAPVERRDLAYPVRAAGRVSHDEDRLARVHPKTDGWIEKLYAAKTGETVARGAALYTFHAPQIVSAQQEYLLALRNRETLEESPWEEIRRGAGDLVRAARERLLFLGVSAAEIEALARTGKVSRSVTIHAPGKGTIMMVGAREGQYIGPQTEVYQLADLTRVWVIVDVYEDDLPWVKVGDEADLRLAALPGETITGRVAFIYPTMEDRTRSARLRLEFGNARGLLKPGMYVDVAIAADARRNVVAVPAEAVVRSGTREQLFVERSPGRFEPRAVRLGVSAGGWVQILEGAEPGETVVTSAQFLIDSESKLREATAKLLEAGSGGEEEMAVHRTTGVMEEIDSSARTLTIAHEAVASLGWPAMTMDFTAGEGIAVDELAAGAAVRFEFSEAAPGEWTVTRIEPAGSVDGNAAHGQEGRP